MFKRPKKAFLAWYNLWLNPYPIKILENYKNWYQIPHTCTHIVFDNPPKDIKEYKNSLTINNLHGDIRCLGDITPKIKFIAKIEKNLAFNVEKWQLAEVRGTRNETFFLLLSIARNKKVEVFLLKSLMDPENISFSSESQSKTNWDN